MMKNITKLAILVGLFLQLGGHPVQVEEWGWDYCTEVGHPFTFYGYKFGWPVPVIQVGQVWGCLTTPNQWASFMVGGLLFSTLFWATVIWVLESYWPIEVAKSE